MSGLRVDLGAPLRAPAWGNAHRWRAVVTYRGEAGPVDVTHEFEELYELHMLIERGPDWNCISDIRITIAETRQADYRTLEEAARR